MIAFMIGTALLPSRNLPSPAGKKASTIATVMQKGDTWILREGQGSGSLITCRSTCRKNLKQMARKWSLKECWEIPANVRLQKPVEITLIKRLYRAVPKDKTDDIGHTDGGDKKQPKTIENLRGVVMLVANTWLIEGEKTGIQSGSCLTICRKNSGRKDWKYL